MRAGCPAIVRPFLLFAAFSLSLGTLQCAAAESPDPVSPPMCCARGGDAGEEDVAKAGDDLATGLSACPGTCSGASMVQGSAVMDDRFAAVPPSPSVLHLGGRSLAPDPHPPRRLVPA